MGVDNLSMVFAPGFLRCIDPSRMMLNSQYEARFVENIVRSVGEQVDTATYDQYSEDGTFY